MYGVGTPRPVKDFAGNVLTFSLMSSDRLSIYAAAKITLSEHGDFVSLLPNKSTSGQRSSLPHVALE